MDGGDSNLPRAFALEVSIDVANAGNIAPSIVTSDYYVAPGTYSYNEATGAVDWGNPIVAADTDSFITEMGSLYAASDPCHPSAPPSSGTLLTFVVDNDCSVALAGNAARAGVGANGVVMEDTETAFPGGYVTLNGCYINLVECEYPACWDYTTQCHADYTSGAGVYPTDPPDGVVSTADFPHFRDGFPKAHFDFLYLANPCGDYDHNGVINTADWPQFRDNFAGPAVPTDCAGGDPCGVYCP
jgi:hypothetical protein